LTTTCEVHKEVIDSLNARPKTTTIWAVVGIFVGAFIVSMSMFFSAIKADVEKIQESTRKIEAAVIENTLNVNVLKDNYENWKKNAPPYHTHHPDGRITKP